MKILRDVLWIEILKIRRSRMPLFTTLGFLLIPAACAFIMFIYKDPEFARQAGLVSKKANLFGTRADWPTYLNILCQSVAIAGMMLFSLIQSWIFGREFVDGTLKDMLAIPLPRFAILAAKYLAAGIWSTILALLLAITGIGLGFLIGLPQTSADTLLNGIIIILVTAVLLIFAVSPFAFFASIGRGYLLPIGVSMLALISAQIMGVLGWGEYYPWAIPAVYASTNTASLYLPYRGFVIVLITAFCGIAATYTWWKYADQCQ